MKATRNSKQAKINRKNRVIKFLIALVSILIVFELFFLKSLAKGTDNTEIPVPETQNTTEYHEYTGKEFMELRCFIPDEPVPLASKDTKPIEEKVEETKKVEETEPIVEESKPRISADGPGEEYYYDLSYQDKLSMAYVVWKEARGEPFEGQVAVAAVILNRYVSEDFNNSIHGVVCYPGAFASISGMCESQLKGTTCMEAVEAACKGYDPTREAFEEGALYFYSAVIPISQYEQNKRNGLETMQIGNQIFHHDWK